jgi:STE24 endopeptidase
MNEDRSARYHRLKRRAAVLSVAVTGALLYVLLASGGAVWMRNLGGGVTAFVLLLAILHEAVTLPVAFYSGYFLERRYGLSSETAAHWAKDHLKGFGLSLVLALAGAHVVYFAIARWPRAWWVISAAVFMGATVLLARAAPVLLLPLFYKFKPLERESLRERLEDLSRRAGVPVLGVYEWGLGERTRRANAALVGTGRTRRIILSDTLLADYTDDEIEVILAHEMGHHVHRDILKGLLVELVVLLLGFFAASRALDWWSASLGLTGHADVAGLPLLLLAGGAISLIVTPFLNAFSRFNERRADRYALTLTRRPSSFISAMKRLGTQNMAEEYPSTASLLLFHTHPPIAQRIAAARAFRG